MHRVVVGAGDGQHEPALEFRQGQAGRGVAVVPAPLGGVGEGGARQPVHHRHRRADQALDDPAPVRRALGTIAQGDAVLPAAAHEGLGMKLRAVVDEDLARPALAGPVRLDAEPAQVGRLVERRMRQAQPGHGGRRRLVGQVQAGDAAAAGVDRHRQPRPADRPPPGLVDKHQVHRRVVDLQHRHGPLGRGRLPDRRRQPPRGGTGASLPGARHHLRAKATDPGADRIGRGRPNPGLAAVLAHRAHHRLGAALLAGQVGVADRLGHDLLGRGRKPPGATATRRGPRSEGGNQPARLPPAPQQGVDRPLRQPERLPGSAGPGGGHGIQRHQGRDHRRAPLRLRPGAVRKAQGAALGHAAGTAVVPVTAAVVGCEPFHAAPPTAGSPGQEACHRRGLVVKHRLAEGVFW